MTPRAAISAAAVGRVSPATAHSTPARIQRPRSTAYSDQAARAVNSVSVYAIDWTNAVGYTPQRTASRTPARGPNACVPHRAIPQAAASPAVQETRSPAVAASRGRTAERPRSRAGRSGKKARSEWTSPFGRVTWYPYPCSAIRTYQTESQRPLSRCSPSFPVTPAAIARTTSPTRRVAA
ncbi:hypothetical protein STANM309S_04357 [Streptomyces tanashiensis]